MLQPRCNLVALKFNKFQNGFDINLQGLTQCSAYPRSGEERLAGTAESVSSDVGLSSLARYLVTSRDLI
jgi:hypothetical protein